jgi:hypothetical protein
MIKVAITVSQTDHAAHGDLEVLSRARQVAMSWRTPDTAPLRPLDMVIDEALQERARTALKPYEEDTRLAAFIDGVSSNELDLDHRGNYQGRTTNGC